MKIRSHIFLLAIALAAFGCKRDEMSDQPRVKPLRPNSFFADGSSARPVVPGTIAREQSTALPISDTEANFPKPLTYDDLKRGQQRFDIYCAVCHGRTGEGNGMIVHRGFTKPPAFFPIDEHRTQFPDLFAREQALLSTPPGHIYNVITNGFGAMYSYSDRVTPEDRWRIAGYIKALQMSRTTKLDDLSETDRAAISGVPATQPAEEMR